MKTTHSDHQTHIRLDVGIHRYRVGLDIKTNFAAYSGLDIRGERDEAGGRYLGKTRDVGAWLKSRLGLKLGDTARLSCTDTSVASVRIRHIGQAATLKQVLVPEWVSKALGTDKGHPVEVSLRRDGSFWHKVLDGRLEDLIGTLRRDERPISLEEMDDAIAEGICGRFLRSCKD